MLLPKQEDFFTDLYRKYFNQIKMYALCLISDPYRAEEIAQDTFHTAMEKIDDVMAADEPIRWLKITAKNKVRNEQRTRQRYLKRFLSLDSTEMPEIASPVSVEQTVLEHEEQGRVPILETVRQTLTSEEVTLLRQVVLERKSHMEVAQEHGISLWACQKRIQRIRGKLGEKFPQYKK